MPTTSKAALAASLLALAAPSFAGAVSKNYLSMTPDMLPANCSGTQEKQDSFLEEVKAIDRRFEEEEKRRDEELKATQKVDQPKVEAVAAARSGVSPQQLARLKQLDEAARHASPEEKKALAAEKRKVASEIMEARTGISMAEVEKMKGQSKEAKARWARSAAADVMATQAADPSTRPPGTMSSTDSRALLEATQLVKELSRRIQAPGEKAGERIGELDKDPEGLRMLKDLGEKRERMGELMGEGSVPEMDRLAREASELEKAYCKRFGPRMLGILGDLRAGLLGSRPDYVSLEQAQAALYKAQTGVDSPAEPGWAELGAARSYLGVLSTIFKYDVRREKR